MWIFVCVFLAISFSFKEFFDRIGVCFLGSNANSTNSMEMVMGLWMWIYGCVCVCVLNQYKVSSHFHVKMKSVGGLV